MYLKRLVSLIGLVQIDFMPPSGYKPDVTTARSVIDCGVFCGEDCACLSFFYAKENSVCQLHNVVLNTTAGLNSKPISSHYYVREVPYPTFTCPTDNTVYRTVKLADHSLFTYKVHKTPKVTHDVAMVNCVSDGAQLVRVTSSAKMDILLQLTTNCTGYSSLPNYWVDLNNSNAVDFEDVTQWVSSVGDPLPIGNDFWAVSQPDGLITDRCAALAKFRDFKLADKVCSANYSYICEKDCSMIQ